jgi:NAD(P)-dependent dehydrogenase (short-subunit alcohol dehydrogenase family)
MRANPFDLTGTVTLVTGANNGLGLGWAHGVAKAGGDVVIWGRRAERNARAAEQLRAHGGRVLAQAVDVSDERRVERALDEAVAELGRIDGVVANAGIQSRQPSFAELSTDDYHRVLAVNLHGAVYTLRAAVRHMLERGGGGSLVVCGSLTVVAGVPRIQPYAAAKGALMAVTRSLAVEYGRHGIRANMVLPGRIETDLGGGTGTEDARFSVIPIPRGGTPADCEGIVVYLLSDASAYHTGDMITVDGGLSVALPGPTP